MIERVNCPVCGCNKATEIWSHVSGIADGVCLNCGHAYLTRQKTEKEIIASYKDFKQAYPEAYLADTKNDLFERAYWRHKFLARNMPTVETINSVLEVGCAYGHFLSLFSPKVIRIGIEPSTDQAAFAKKHFNLSEIINSPYELIDKKPKGWPDYGFDLFCSYHVIEHVKNPGRLLDFARLMLRSDGYICLAVPNLFALSPDIIEYFFLFKNWHLNIFTPSSLSRLLAKFGFETLHWEVEPPTAMLRNSFIVLARKQTISQVQFVSSVNIQDSVQALADFHNILDRCIHSIRQTFGKWHSQGLTICIYGAGIHTTALLELSDIERKYVKFIIDDDPKKWGLKINNIQVTNLNDALLHKPDVILVSSLASEEIILQKLRQYLRTGIKVVGVYRDLASHLK